MRPDPSPQPGWRTFAILTVACAIAFLASAFRADFVNFDDPRLFGPQSEIAAGGLARILDPTATIADVYLPVTHLSLAFDAAVFGRSALGPHLHSLLLHVLVAFAFARLAARLGLSTRAATAAALVFALHPAVAEPVMWVASRKDLLAGLFSMLALLCVLRAADGGASRRRAIWLAAGCTLLAVYSKHSALVLPLLAFVVLRVHRGPAPGRALPLAAIAVVAVLVAIHHALIAAGAGTMAAVDASFGSRLAQVPGAFLHYLTTTLWPRQLNVLYPEVDTLAAFRANLVPGLVALAAMVAAIVVSARRAPLVAAGLACWCLALLPYNTALPATALAAADRYLYLALPGFALAVAAIPRIGPAVAGLLLLPFLWWTHERAADFESSRSLWNSSLAVAPDNAVARTNLALFELQADPLAAAIGGPLDVDAVSRAEIQLERALEVARYPQHRLRAATLLSDLADAAQHFERAARYMSMAAEIADELGALAGPGIRVPIHLKAARLARVCGDLERAKEHFAAAEELAPGHPEVLCFAAAVLQADAVDAHGAIAPDDPRAAEIDALLAAAEKVAPELYELLWTRGEWSRARGMLLAAEKDLKQATDVDPRRPEAWIARVDLFLAQPGMASHALKIAQQGLAAVDDPKLRFRLALALSLEGRLDDAQRHYEAYLALRPNDPQARTGLAAVLAASGIRRMNQLDPAALDELATRILGLDPFNQKARLMQAVAARGERRLLDALVLLEALRAELPEDEEIERLFAETLRDRGWQLVFEGRDDAAHDHFRRFLDIAPAAVPTDAVDEALRQAWRRHLDAGKEALVAEDADEALRRFERCDELRPDDAAQVDYFLGLALFAQRGDDGEVERLERALACFERAEASRRAAEQDAGLALFYQLRTLLRLGRDADAQERGEAFLSSAAEVDPNLRTRIEDALRR